MLVEDVSSYFWSYCYRKLQLRLVVNMSATFDAASPS